MSKSSLSGTLADGKSGQPVGSIRAWVYQRQEWTGRAVRQPWDSRFEGLKLSAVSNEDGDYTIENIPIPAGLDAVTYGVCTEPSARYAGTGGAKLFHAGKQESWNPMLFTKTYVDKWKEWWKFLRWW